MRYAATMICALATVFLYFSSCEQGPEKPVSWITYRADEAGFTVAIPAGYQEFRDESVHAFGPHQAFSVYWRKPGMILSRLGLKLLSAGYYEIPELQNRYGAAYILDSFVKEEIRLGGTDKNGRILEYVEDSIGRFPSRQFCSIVDNGKADSLFLCERFVLAGPRMYHLRTNGYMRQLDTPAMRHFLQSFRITKS